MRCGFDSEKECTEQCRYSNTCSRRKTGEDIKEYNGIVLGDLAICKSTKVCGKVIKIYDPTACARQIMVETADGRRYHAPAEDWVRFNPGDIEIKPLISEPMAAGLAQALAMPMARTREETIQEQVEKQLYSGLNVMNFGREY